MVVLGKGDSVVRQIENGGSPLEKNCLFQYTSRLMVTGCHRMSLQKKGCLGFGKTVIHVVTLSVVMRGHLARISKESIIQMSRGL